MISTLKEVEWGLAAASGLAIAELELLTCGSSLPGGFYQDPLGPQSVLMEQVPTQRLPIQAGIGRYLVRCDIQGRSFVRSPVFAADFWTSFGFRTRKLFRSRAIFFFGPSAAGHLAQSREKQSALTPI